MWHEEAFSDIDPNMFETILENNYLDWTQIEMLTLNHSGLEPGNFVTPISVDSNYLVTPQMAPIPQTITTESFAIPIAFEIGSPLSLTYGIDSSFQASSLSSSCGFSSNSFPNSPVSSCFSPLFNDANNSIQPLSEVLDSSLLQFNLDLNSKNDGTSFHSGDSHYNNISNINTRRRIIKHRSGSNPNRASIAESNVPACKRRGRPIGNGACVQCDCVECQLFISSGKFVCSTCNRPFARIGDLKRHQRTANIPCDIPGCSQMFTRLDNKKTHILKCHKERQDTSIRVSLPVTMSPSNLFNLESNEISNLQFYIDVGADAGHFPSQFPSF
ncbi:hypothetical protein HK096_002155, partial [Nowakowskiella sp. JEL0078]